MVSLNSNLCGTMHDKRGQAGMIFDVRKVGGKSSRVLKFIGSDDTLDRFDSIINQDGWRLKNFKRNPVFLWCHAFWEPPIGKAISVRVRERHGRKVLAFLIEFPEKGMHPFADLIFNLYKGGFIKAVSVGFMPIKSKFIDDEDEIEELGLDPKQVKRVELLIENELFELSAVPVPANANALIENLASMPALRGFRFPPASRLKDELETRKLLEEIRTMLNNTATSTPAWIKALTLPNVAKGVDWQARAEEVQTVVFSKEVGDWTEEKAKTWLEENNMQFGKVDETETSWRFQQFDPEKCVGEFVTLTEELPEGVAMVACDTGGSGHDEEDEDEDDETTENDTRGAKLAGLLNRRIDEMARGEDEEDDKPTRAEIIAKMAEEAGIDEATVNQILDGTIECPPIERLEAFAKVLGLEADTVVGAAREDGCTYDEDGEEEEEEEEEEEPTTEGARMPDRHDFDKAIEFAESVADNAEKLVEALITLQDKVEGDEEEEPEEEPDEEPEADEEPGEMSGGRRRGRKRGRRGGGSTTRRQRNGASKLNRGQMSKLDKIADLFAPSK